MKYFITILILFSFQTSYSQMTPALEAMETGQHKKAFKLLQKELKKKKKDSTTYMMLADLYATGSGTKRDFEKSESLLYQSEKYTPKLKDCSLSVLALKFNAFYKYLLTIRNPDEDLKMFMEKIKKDATDKHGYKEGVCPQHDKGTNYIGY